MANFQEDEDLVMADEVEEAVEEVVPVEEAQVVAGEEVTAGPVRTPMGSIKALGMGAADIVSMGYSDEAARAAGFSGYPAAKQQAEQEYPGAYGLGQAVGGLGAAVAAPEAIVSKLGQVGTAALAGGLYGSGRAETVGDIPIESAKGIGEGLFGLGVGKLAGKALQLGGKLVEQIGAVTSGVAPRDVGRFMQRPAEVDASGQLDELATEISVNLDNLREQNLAASAAATDLLPRDTEIPTEPFRQYVKSLAMQAGALRDPRERAAARILLDYLSPTGMFPKGKMLTPMDIKLNMVSLGKILQGKFGDSSSLEDGYRKGIRHFMRQFLTDNFPDYDKAMVPVRYGFAVEEEAERYFGNKAAIPSKLISMANNPERNFDYVRVLNSLDDVMKTRLGEENIDRRSREAFERATTTGARKVLGGTAIGTGVASAFGLPPEAGAAFGAMAGGAADIYGGPMAKGGITAYLAAKRGMGKAIGSGGPAGLGALGAATGVADNINIPSAEAKEFTLPESLKNSPYMQMIEESKQRGEGAVGATHFILMKNDPEYRKRYLGVDYTE